MIDAAYISLYEAWDKARVIALIYAVTMGEDDPRFIKVHAELMTLDKQLKAAQL